MRIQKLKFLQRSVSVAIFKAQGKRRTFLNGVTLSYSSFASEARSIRVI